LPEQSAWLTSSLTLVALNKPADRRREMEEIRSIIYRVFSVLLAPAG
jgi:hypothetical protein